MNQQYSQSKFWQDLKSGRFVDMVKEAAKGRSLSNSTEVYHVMKPLFAKESDVEKVFVIFLDSQNKILGIENLFSGSLTASTIYPRELAKKIIEFKAGAFVLSHNHPSGDITPSSEDISVTMKIGLTAASIDVSFHDHVIIGDGFYSFADNGMLQNISRKFSELMNDRPLADRRAS
jgi:DNA repair protein RadC